MTNERSKATPSPPFYNNKTNNLDQGSSKELNLTAALFGFTSLLAIAIATLLKETFESIPQSVEIFITPIFSAFATLITYFLVLYYRKRTIKRTTMQPVFFERDRYNEIISSIEGEIEKQKNRLMWTWNKDARKELRSILASLRNERKVYIQKKWKKMEEVKLKYEETAPYGPT